MLQQHLGLFFVLSRLTYPLSVFTAYRTRCVSFVIADDTDEGDDPYYGVDKETQTDVLTEEQEETEEKVIRGSRPGSTAPIQRGLEESLEILNTSGDASSVTDGEVLNLIQARKLEPRSLEKVLGDAKRGVRIRRQFLAGKAGARVTESLRQIPHEGYEFSNVIKLGGKVLQHLHDQKFKMNRSIHRWWVLAARTLSATCHCHWALPGPLRWTRSNFTYRWPRPKAAW